MPIAESTAAALIAAGASTASTGATIASNAVKNKKQYKYWLKQQKVQQQYQIASEERQQEYLNKQNEYNSIQSQMARYRLAGLNANLATGVQPVAADAVNTSSQTASPMPVNGFMDGVNFNVTDAYQVYMNNERLEMERELNDANIRNIDENTKAQEIENKYRDKLKSQNVTLNDLSISEKQLEIAKKTIENDRASIALDIEKATKSIKIDSENLDFLSKGSKYQYNLLEYAHNIKMFKDIETKVKNEALQSAINVALSKCHLDSEKVKNAFYSMLSPHIDDFVNFGTSEIDKLKETGLADYVSNLVVNSDALLSEMSRLLDALGFDVDAPDVKPTRQDGDLSGHGF